MENSQGGRFPDWDNLYRQDVKTMPWYNESLDADLEREIKLRKITRGGFLDLGTGPGTQAIQLAKMGFDVTGTDLSENAIQKARRLDDGKINLIVDDILNSRLEKNSFDYILDREDVSMCYPLTDGINMAKRYDIYLMRMDCSF